jgi:hypothetical protein
MEEFYSVEVLQDLVKRDEKLSCRRSLYDSLNLISIKKIEDNIGISDALTHAKLLYEGCLLDRDASQELKLKMSAMLTRLRTVSDQAISLYISTLHNLVGLGMPYKQAKINACDIAKLYYKAYLSIN